MLLSIIIPAYNVERFIARTLGTFISQNLKDCEIIVVNDGSKDRTLEIAEQIAKKESCIKVINQENKGVSVARNVGLKNASGKYIYFMDSDDTIADGTLDFWRNLLNQNKNCNVYAFGYKALTGNKEKKYVFSSFDKQTLKNPLLKQIFLAKKICFHICSCIYESKFLQENNLKFTPGVKIGEDVEFILKVLEKTNALYYDARECFIYLIRNDSAMQGYKAYSKVQYHSVEICQDICFSENYQSEEIKKYTNFWLQNLLLSNIVNYLRSNVKDKEITQNLISDLKLLKLPAINGALKNSLAIKLAKLLPLKMMLKILK